MRREELLAKARGHLWAAWQLSSEELGSQAAETLLGLGMLVPEGGAQELEQLRADAESARVDGQRLIRAEQRRAELEAVLATHRQDDQAKIERLRARVAELEAKLRIGAPWKCHVCGKDNRRDVCVVCETDRPEPRERTVDEDLIAFALTPEATCGRALSTGKPCPDHSPRAERSYWEAIAAALNAAHAVGMPVGIDLDGTLTDHQAWSVVWDRGAERWAVAGYEDDAEADGITRRIEPAQDLRETVPTELRAEDIADILTLAPAEHAAVERGNAFELIVLELTATPEQWRVWQTALKVDLARTTNRGGCVTSHAVWRGVHVVVRCWWARPETGGEGR